MILQQLLFAKQMLKPHVYLGYQVDECRKMTYKNKAGSRGKVKLEDGTLTFRNAFTGNNYKVIVKKK